MITFYFIGLDNIIINEILYIFQDNDFIFVRNIQSNDKYVWTQEDLGIYYWKENFAFCFFTRIFSIMKILLGIFMLSNITSIYIKMTIICAPVFVLIMSKIIHFLFSFIIFFHNLILFQKIIFL